MKAKKTSGKSPAPKGPPAGSEGNSHKRLESERIASDIAEYEKSGGKVEKLGVTRVLQTVAPRRSARSPSPRPRCVRARAERALQDAIRVHRRIACCESPTAMPD